MKKVHATLDGSIVSMGVKDADGSVCCIHDILKSIRNEFFQLFCCRRESRFLRHPLHRQMQEIRYLDKLVDGFAKGNPMDKKPLQKGRKLQGLY